MHIAIIGGGLFGLSIAWHLLKKEYQVSLFDTKGIGGGASGIAAGLLHPFAGEHAKLNFKGLEGFQATLDLIDLAEHTLQKKVALRNGLLRVPFAACQAEDFAITSQKYKETLFLNSKECQEKIPGIDTSLGLFIPSSLQVNTPLYLEGLFQACVQKGLHFYTQEIQDLKELAPFDHTIIAAGKGCLDFFFYEEVPLNLVKGTLLSLYWEERAHLPIPLNSKAYLIEDSKPHHYLLGATFEKNYKQEEPDLLFAKEDLFPKITPFLKGFEKASILSGKSALRVYHKSNLPFIKTFHPKLSLATGLGSKGLLYHALYGKLLADTFL